MRYMHMDAPRLQMLKIGALALAIAAMLAVSGCSNDADAQRIAELEAQVAELQGQADDAADTATTTDDDAAAAAQAPTSIAPEADASVLEAYPEVASFTSRVEELEASCAAVTAGSDAAANYQTYLEMKAQLDLLDDEMDLYDDQQEYAARTGSIEYNDYIQIETALDRLSDRLDYAEDSMEFTLGIYDD